MSPWIAPVILGIAGSFLADKIFSSRLLGSAIVGIVSATVIMSYIRWTEGYWDKFSLVAFLTIFTVSTIVALATSAARRHFWSSATKQGDNKN